MVTSFRNTFKILDTLTLLLLLTFISLKIMLSLPGLTL